MATGVGLHLWDVTTEQYYPGLNVVSGSPRDIVQFLAY
jgi:hypothetical protein